MKFKLLFIFTLIFSSLPLCAMDQELWKSERFLKATYYGDIEYVKASLLDGTHPDTRIMPDQHWSNPTPLIIAADKGHFEIAQLLLKYHANVNAQDKYGWTPLMVATRRGNLKIVQLLLKNHADVNAFNDGNETALIISIKNGFSKITKLLLHHNADVNISSPKGKTPLMYASANGDAKIVKLLIKHGADINATIHHDIFHDGDTSLTRACHIPKIVNILLKHNANITTDKDSPLTIATRFNHFKSAELLLKHINHILDKNDDPKIWQKWDQYILDALKSKDRVYCCPIQTINIFQMILHHASKLPLSTKKLESVTAKTLGHHDYGERSFRKRVKHLRKSAF